MKKITLLFICLLSSIVFAQPGTIDFGFNSGGAGPDTAAYATVTQPDGKIIVAGTFDNYNGTTRSGIARLNADGTLDLSFNPGTGLALSTEYIYCVALQTDGKIMIGGKFANFNGTARNNIARLNADGTVDASFNPGTGTNNDVVTISIQSTGKIIIGGLFSTYNGVSKPGFLRVDANGTIDAFNVGGVGPNLYVWTTSVRSDDKIYVGGGFSQYNGAEANHLLRLNADGTRDATYTSGRYTNNAVLAHAVQPDGKIIIGGLFTNYGGVGVPKPRLARINDDGTLDATFNIGTGLNNYPLSIVCQPNGKILVGGAFTSYNGTSANNIIRLNSDATVDASFLSGTGMNGIVYHAAFQTTGKLLVSSASTVYNGNTSKPNLVMLNGYEANAVTVTSFSEAAPYCVEQALTVNYNVTGFYASGNVFTAQLSDASGSFAAPTTIGSTVATTSGSINITIPLITPAGNGYRIRVSSSLPPTVGADNGTDIVISAPNTYYIDADNDGYGNPETAQTACFAPIGYVIDNTDCDDNDNTANPGATEILYDGIDNNCDGNLDEGNQLTTSLLNCNATLASIGSLNGITTVAGHTITSYRIRATNGAEVQIIEKGVPHFTMTQFPSYAYATTYTIEIELQRNGIWLGYYGAACQVTTPNILEEGGAAGVSPAQCGITLAKINTLIASTSIPGVTGYRFRVTNNTDPLGANAVQIVDRALNWFSLQMLTRYNYGTTYTVEVAVKTTGDYSGYGAACEVSSPAVPTLTSCNTTISSMSANIATTSLSGVTQYRFQVTRASDNASTIISRNVNYFTFNNVPALLFSAGELYNVRVGLLTSGTWSPYGDACEIIAPGALARPNAFTDTMPSEFKAAVYPNPFVSSFNIYLQTNNTEDIVVKVYDMLGRMTELKMVAADVLNTHQLGNNYPAGVYNVVVTQGEMVKTLRVIKR